MVAHRNPYEGYTMSNTPLSSVPTVALNEELARRSIPAAEGQEGLARSTDALNDEPAGRPIPQDPEAALFETEASHLAGPSVRTLQAFRLRGGGPVFFYAGTRRAVRYRRRDVLDWIEQRIRRSTSDPGPIATLILVWVTVALGQA